jgi:DNA gyrase subunit B
MSENKDYSADSIKVLEGLEGVRRRPSMYIGSTGKDGLHHLVYEIVDNSVDEALAGYCKNIIITLNKDGSITVVDDGRGIPVEINKQHKKSALEIVFTKLHAGGKFDKDSYKISGGLHGVGASVVNALSTKLIVNVKRDGKIYEQVYKNGGKPVDDPKAIGKYNEKEGTGTTVTFFPDASIFSTLVFDFAVLKKRLQEIAFLNAGLRVVLEDMNLAKKEEFYYSGGLIEFIQHITHAKSPFHKPIYFKKQSDSTIVEVAIQYSESYNENIFGFVNTINTTEGGTHISGFKSALTGVINDYAKKKGLIKDVDIEGDDTREGLTAIVSLKLADPQFEGQTKTKLGNSEVKGIVDSMTTIALGEYFEQNPNVANKIVSKVIAAAKARDAAKKARDLVRRKNAFGFSGLPGKLADCSSKKFEKTELFICEGDSAAGSSKSARDKEFQAILPLRGKILNVEKANPIKALSSEEIANLITAIGTGVKENFNPEKLRYNKIIIMCDADSVDFNNPIMLYNKESKEVCYKKIGEFIDKDDNSDNFQIMTFNDNRLKLKDIRKLVKHLKRTDMFEIKTYCGYKINATSCHSVFVYENGKIIAKETKQIKIGDLLITPKFFPHPVKNYNIDVRKLLKKIDGIQVKIGKQDINFIPQNAWIDLSKSEWNKLKKIREGKSISKEKIARECHVYKTAIQQWEEKIDNVMPLYKSIKKYLNTLRIKLQDLDYSIFVPLDSYKGEAGECFYRNHISKIKESFEVDEDFAYLLGWYLGDGCFCPQEKNPNRFGISVGNDKEYISRLGKTLAKVLGVNLIYDRMNIYFHSLEFRLILDKLGLLGKKAKDKFIPYMFFNVDGKIQTALLEGLLHSDGHIIVNKDKIGKIKAVIGFTTISEDLANGILFLFRQRGIFPRINERLPLERARYKRYTIDISTFDYLNKCFDVWKSHKFSKKLKGYLSDVDKKKVIGKYLKPLSKDFFGIKVKEINKIKTENDYVYDLSVPPTQNFIAGNGGFMLHNTDGEHITTLLLTFFFRYAPQLIENGNIFIAVAPLFRIRKGKDIYVYSEDELKKILEKLGGKADIQRFKGLGEMNAEQLWETTMNPKTRILKKVNIEDAVEADKTFSMLMGDEVGPRREFIQKNAHIAELDV